MGFFSPYMDYLTQLLYASVTVKGGDTITGVTVDTAFASCAAIPANFLKAGEVINIKGGGVYSTPVVPGTTVAKIKFGTVALLATAALVNPASVTNVPFTFEVNITVISIGAAGTIEASGTLFFMVSGGTVAVPITLANTGVVTVDTTAAKNLTINVTPSVAGLTFTLRQLIVMLSSSSSRSN